ncbi:MAG: hypothetical protein ABSF09_14345 [Candidatus Bathyarchaeia archaeon]|jgi:hypothetical protein
MNRTKPKKFSVLNVETLIIALSVITLTSMAAPLANSQETNTLDSLTFQAFSQVANVYALGGQAPALVDELNKALSLLQESRVSQSSGNVTQATALESEARSLISDVLARAPSAAHQASVESSNKIIYTVATIPIIVAISTICFYAVLRSWSRYERAKLFELRIVEKENA